MKTWRAESWCGSCDEDGTPIPELAELDHYLRLIQAVSAEKARDPGSPRYLLKIDDPNIIKTIEIHPFLQSLFAKR